METIQIVRCPCCGEAAQRQFFPAKQLLQMACPNCGCMHVICTTTGKVFEAYAPHPKHH
jgi:hypothetical protein